MSGRGKGSIQQLISFSHVLTADRRECGVFQFETCSTGCCD